MDVDSSSDDRASQRIWNERTHAIDYCKGLSNLAQAFPRQGYGFPTTYAETAIEATTDVASSANRVDTSDT
jgi:hypothetical protein